MDIQRDVRIAGKQPTFFLAGEKGKEWYKAMVEYWELPEGTKIMASLFYNLGRIHGKREERARRKR